MSGEKHINLGASRVNGMGELDDSGNYIRLAFETPHAPIKRNDITISEGAAEMLRDSLKAILSRHPTTRGGQS